MNHLCHWPGCNVSVPPAMFHCRVHWYTLPKHLRDKIWATYRAGQEISKTPSREYLEVVQECNAWALEYMKNKK